MDTTTSTEINLGELRAQIEWQTVPDAASVSLRPLRIQLVLVPPPNSTSGHDLLRNVVVLGEIAQAEPRK